MLQFATSRTAADGKRSAEVDREKHLSSVRREVPVVRAATRRSKLTQEDTKGSRWVEQPSWRMSEFRAVTPTPASTRRGSTPHTTPSDPGGVGGSSSRWRAMIMGIEKQKELDSFFKFKLMAA